MHVVRLGAGQARGEREATPGPINAARQPARARRPTLGPAHKALGAILGPWDPLLDPPHSSTTTGYAGTNSTHSNRT